MQRWVLAGVAVVGIVLAILLFPRPDTGQSAAPPGTSVQSPKPGDGPARRRRKGRPDKPRADEETSPALIVELRSQPEAVYAGRLIAPWSAVRYALMRADDATATALADDIRDVLVVLQSGRRDPRDMTDFEATAGELSDLAERVRDSAWADEEIVQKALKRHDIAIAEYRAIKDSTGTATEETP